MVATANFRVLKLVQELKLVLVNWRVQILKEQLFIGLNLSMHFINVAFNCKQISLDARALFAELLSQLLLSLKLTIHQQVQFVSLDLRKQRCHYFVHQLFPLFHQHWTQILLNSANIRLLFSHFLSILWLKLEQLFGCFCWVNCIGSSVIGLISRRGQSNVYSCRDIWFVIALDSIRN